MQELQRTAFNELLGAALSPIFSGSFEYTVTNTELNTNAVAGTGTITQGDAMAIVSTGGDAGSTALLKSKRHVRQRSGLGGILRFTTLFDTPIAGTEQYQGITDELGSAAAFKNGLTVGYDGLTFGFQQFTNDAKTSVAQADFSIDTLNGRGYPGALFVPTKLNAWQIRHQPGAGELQLWYESQQFGIYQLVHRIKYTNQNTVPSSFNPHYHFTMWVANKAVAADLTIKSATYGYFMEGLQDKIDLHQPRQSSGIREKTTVTTEVAIFTIRNKATYAGKTNFIDVELENITVSIEASSANNLGQVRLVKNATLGGVPSWTDINTTDSVVEIDLAGTTVTGGKEVLPFTLAGKNDDEHEDLIIYDIEISPGDTLTAAGLSANSATIDAAILWKELF